MWVGVGVGVRVGVGGEVWVSGSEPFTRTPVVTLYFWGVLFGVRIRASGEAWIVGRM